MKLGEARLEVKQLDKELDILEEFLEDCSLDMASSVVDICSDFLDKKGQLEKSIMETSQNILIDGPNTVLDVERISRGFNRKINLLDNLTHNKNLEEENKDNIIKKLMEYRTTQRTLETTLQRCYWDNDLLE